MDTVTEALERALSTRQVAHAFQPIWRIAPPLLHGFEALARFPNGARPDLVWDEARRQGVTMELDQISVHCAVAEASVLSGHLFVNVDGSWFDQDARQALSGLLTDELLVYEVTEQPADETASLPTGRDWFQRWGSFLALDDAGSGASTVGRFLTLQPRYVKLDKSLVDAWILDPAHKEFVAWMEAASSVGASVLAEGIEDPTVVARLHKVGVSYIQGFAFGKPMEASNWTPHTVASLAVAVAT